MLIIHQVNQIGSFVCVGVSRYVLIKIDRSIGLSLKSNPYGLIKVPTLAVYLVIAELCETQRQCLNICCGGLIHLYGWSKGTHTGVVGTDQVLKWGSGYLVTGRKGTDITLAKTLLISEIHNVIATPTQRSARRVLAVLRKEHV